jgi:hypothetical protein
MFWIVWNASRNEVVVVEDDVVSAFNIARGHAETAIGDTFVVLEPKEAFRASAHVSKVFLRYPVRPPEPEPADDRIPDGTESPHVPLSDAEAKEMFG